MRRRDMLRTAAIGGAWVLLGRHLERFADAQNPRARPNVVVILADDMGFSDIGCYGGEVHTPNVDRLAAEGVRFTQGYNTARCCPTRAALLTGLYSHEAGVGHMLVDTGLPGYTPFLNDRCVTLGEAMRPVGYTTLQVGKWHVGGGPGHLPVDRGFDESYVLPSGGSSYWKPGQGAIKHNGDDVAIPEENFYLTDYFSDRAVELLDRHGHGPKPFFLYLAYTAPHWPLHAPKDEIKKYLDLYTAGWDTLRAARLKRQVDMGLIDPRWKLSDRDAVAWEEATNKDERVLRMACYAAQIDRMDQGIGRVMAKLKALGVDDNTLVMFWSDNGGCAEIIERGQAGVPTGEVGSWRSYGKPWANLSNTPFRYYKHWVHEGGISTPVIARWPSAIRKTGGFITEPCHVIDILPTALDVAGGTYPKQHNGKDIQPVEGVSLAPLFDGRPLARKDALYWEHEGNRAMRDGKWKLVARNNSPWELYDMEADRTETSDLAAKESERVKAMVAKWDAWAARANVEPWDKVARANSAAARRAKAAPKADTTPAPE